MNQQIGEPENRIPVEQALDAYFTAPAPRPTFLTSMEQAIQTGSLTIRANRTPMVRRPLVFAFLAVAVLMIVFIIIGPSNALAAVQRLIRYIPGFGLVDEKTTLRVLAQPVSMTRDGVTVTVTQAILSPDQTSLMYTVQGLPTAAIPQWVVSEKDHICSGVTELRLVSGKQLEQRGGGNGGYNDANQYQYILAFEPVPLEDNQATWTIPCIPQTLTGKAPGDWEIPLRFVPAPANMTQMPVVEITSTQGSETKEPGENPVSLDRVVETDSGYIFIGRFRQILPAPVTGVTPEIRDANGLLLGYIRPADISTSGDISQVVEWAYQIHSKELTWPITIQFPSVSVDCNDPQTKITLNVGEHPQAGQVWKINQDYSLGPCIIHLDYIKRTSNGYLFRLSNNENISEFDPVIEGAEASSRENKQVPLFLETALTYEQEPPKGILTISLSAFGQLSGPWQVQWQPEKK